MKTLEQYKKALELACAMLKNVAGYTACDRYDGCPYLDNTKCTCTRPEEELDKCLPEYFLSEAVKKEQSC